jgi:putative nucleotidyltransferase with HDIG domain
MSGIMTRDQALALLREHVKADVLVKHSLATEAIMRALARKLGQDEALWGIAGLLHDLDFETTKESSATHGLKTEEILRSIASTHPLPEEGIQAIKGHNAENLGLPRVAVFDKAITAAETVTGLIVATALVQPDKKLASVKLKSVTKRLKEKAFARNVSRERIAICGEIGIPVEEFVGLSLAAMQGVANDLGL